MIIRPALPAEAPAIAALVEAAFGRPEEAALVEGLRGEGAVAIELLAEVPGGGLLGHILLSRMTVGGAPALALAPLSVAPAAWRRGIGAALVGQGLGVAALGAEGWCLVLGEPRYYGRFGFSAAAAARVTGVPWAGHPAFQALALRRDAPPLAGDARYACAFGLPAAETGPT